MNYAERHPKPPFYRDITRHFPREASILDVGCGTAWLAECFPSYTGIDGSPEMVDAAAAQGRQVVLGDVEAALPFEDEQFDGAVLKDLLEHVADPVATVRETLRVLKPGGRAFASSPDAQRWAWNDYTHRRPFTRTSFRELFADQGFEVERVGYEALMRGTWTASALVGRGRRPWPVAATAWLPFLNRNVWVVARRPPRGAQRRAATASARS